MIEHPLNKYRLLIFDADGTLRRCTVPCQPCPNEKSQWELMPNVKETLALYPKDRFRLAIASNQGGVALGYLSHNLAMAMLQDTAREAFGYQLYYGVRMCPHNPEAGCPCRKPSPFMLLEIIRDYGCTRDNTLFVGDHWSDESAASRAMVDYMTAAQFFGWGAEGAHAV